MLTVEFVKFFLQFIIANLVAKMLAIWTVGTPVGNAIAFIG